MRTIRRTSQFKRDVERMKRRERTWRNTETTCSLGDTEVRESVISHQIGC